MTNIIMKRYFMILKHKGPKCINFKTKKLGSEIIIVLLI